GFWGFSPSVTYAVAGVEGVELVSPQSLVLGRIQFPDGDTSDTTAFGIDPTTIDAVFEVEMVEGRLADLTDDGIVLDRQVVEDHGLRLGDTVTMTIETGEAVELEVQAISDDQIALGSYTVSRAGFLDRLPSPTDIQIFGTVAEGADLDAVLEDIEAATASVPGLVALDEEGFRGAIAEQINQLLIMVSVLLGLSIIIAMIGIANTLSLSIHERTRELGLLRAVGMGRRQLRGMVRWEAVMISVLGAAVGLGRGVGLGWAFVNALRREGFDPFALPIAPLVVTGV